jgi:hypothetical protein
MRRGTPLGTNLKLFAMFAVIFSLAFARVHMRVETTLIGYEIGQLKSEEAKLLENRSHLRMLHAKLTTKEHLKLMAAKNLDSKLKNNSLAVH